MRFAETLIPGRLLRRYKRFFAEVELTDGETVTAHCPNPGSMLGLADAGLEVWLSRANNPKRKLAYGWELVSADGTLVGINTGLPNRIVAEALESDAVPELAGYDGHRREVRYGENSRIDLLLERAGAPDCYLEVKNVHLRRQPGIAEFPDSVTARGAKHLRELTSMVEAGHRAVMLYLVQRGDCDALRIAADIDPAYRRALDSALAKGVEALCYACDISPEEIVLAGRLPLDL